MKAKILYIIIFILCGSFTYSQMYSDNNLKNIYQKIVFPDDSLKRPEWRINDLDLISEILRYLIANDELKENTDDFNIIDRRDIPKLWEQVHANQVRIVCRGRQNDDQVDHIEVLVEGEQKYKSIEDWLTIKAALSNSTYERIKRKKYDYTDTKQNYITAYNKSYIMLNVLHSELDLISFDYETKGIISSFYQLGCDNIILPSWYKGNIAVGFKFKLYTSSIRNNSNYERFSIALGWDGPIRFATQNKILPEFMKDMFKKRLLYGTSENVYIGFTFSPSNNDPIPLNWYDEKNEKFIRLQAEASIPYSNNIESLPNYDLDNFYSIRGHFSLTGTVCNIAEFLNLGASFSYFQLYNYSKYVKSDLSILGSKKHYLVAFEPAISREDHPFSYNISPQINYDFSNGQTFFVLKSDLMFFDTFGIEFKYFESLNKKKTAPWQYDNYVVISPTFRISY